MVGRELYSISPLLRNPRQEWDSLFCDAGEKRMIEATVERYPDQERFMVGLCIVQRRVDQ